LSSTTRSRMGFVTLPVCMFLTGGDTYNPSRSMLHTGKWPGKAASKRPCWVTTVGLVPMKQRAQESDLLAVLAGAAAGGVLAPNRPFRSYCCWAKSRCRRPPIWRVSVQMSGLREKGFVPPTGRRRHCSDAVRGTDWNWLNQSAISLMH
jgi:hypothetical protein